MLLKRYILKQISQYAMVVTIVLIVIFSGVEFSAIMRSSVSGSIPHGLLGKALLFQMPFLLSLLLPLVLLLAGILVINNLHDSGELTVVKASGIDNFRINIWIMNVAVIIFMSVALTSLYLEPKASKAKNQMFKNIDKDFAISNFQPGQFYPILKGDAVAFVGKSLKSGSAFGDIFIAHKEYNEGDKTPVWNIVTAEKAVKSEAASREWGLHNAWNFAFKPGDKEGDIINAKDFFVSFPEEAKQQLEKSNFEEMSVTKLTMQQHSLLAMSLLQWRLSLPISVLILALFIVPFSYERFFGTQFLRLFAAVTFYAVYLSTTLVFRYLVSVGKLTCLYGVVMPPIIFVTIIGLYYCKDMFCYCWSRLWR